MTPQEFGEWLEKRSEGNWYEYHSSGWDAREAHYYNECDAILQTWLNVDWGQEWRPNPASTEGTQHSESLPMQPRTRFQDVTLPEPESPETT